MHISNYYYTEPLVNASKMLVENSDFDKVFFCNSGAEANEAAIKLAKKYGKLKSEDKIELISMKQSFHGRTCGALTATGQEKYQKNFLPLLPGTKYAVYNDIESLKEIISEKTCGVILEVIQGESGIIPVQVEYLKQVEELCHKYDALLIIDEVQSGMGRTGKLFAYENFGIHPDVVSTAKGLGGGVPVGAMLCKDDVAVFVPGDHASTFGGNPMVTTAATVVMDELVNNGLLAHVQEVGAYLTEKLNVLKDEVDCVTDVRGIGLMQGVEITKTPKDIVSKCMEKGMLIASAGTNVIRFVPPLIVTKEEIDEAVAILKEALV
ncbi:acetylornithine/succinylornithine family transaminase [Cellulosilyticum ruminicola]|uniref:acetylornithine/succinylornithine family transaminase n=1 Tax=Cellulosilyticum ruminicola TaxID=425254 RepID=UPI00278C10A3|nr:acetylornithine/succinylornithine family transaminase [Cellulosilyticum ruminicola]